VKIFTTWTDELRAFRHFFEGHEVNLLPKQYKGLKMDLLIFPGGDDVQPERYGYKMPENSNYAHWVNPERDAWEFQVHEDVIKGKLLTSKVLGICRGMQLLNVAFSGKLIYDIAGRTGNGHPSYHPIKWKVDNIFSSIKMVNSLHHQAIGIHGHDMRYILLGVEPNSGIAEAAMWGDKFLGMQFHPELGGNDEDMRLISKGILDWVEGKNNIITGVELPKSRYTLTYEATIASDAVKSFAAAFVGDDAPKVTPWDDDEQDELEMLLQEELEEDEDE
jgi:putative glutamine amidotransferase